MTFAMEKNRWGRKLVFDKAREKVMEQSKGMYPAPLTILEVVAADSDEAEAKGFGDLLCTPESKGLRHLFDCITEFKKTAGGNQKSDNTDDEKEEMTQQKTQQYVGMIGAWTGWVVVLLRFWQTRKLWFVLKTSIKKELMRHWAMPTNILKDEEKIHPNKNTNREWSVFPEVPITTTV